MEKTIVINRKCTAIERSDLALNELYRYKTGEGEMFLNQELNPVPVDESINAFWKSYLELEEMNDEDIKSLLDPSGLFDMSDDSEIMFYDHEEEF